MANQLDSLNIKSIVGELSQTIDYFMCCVSNSLPLLTTKSHSALFLLNILLYFNMIHAL